MSKPTLFIGSSSESLNIAFAAQANLEDYAQVLVWKQGVFELSKFVLESLLDVLDESDFGLFIFSPNDILAIRGQELHAVRDNVIFELGLFIGRLGRSRSFIIMPKGAEDMRLPSDLLGVNVGTFVAPETDKPRFLEAALGPVCFEIQGIITKAVESKTSAPPKTPMAVAVPELLRNHLVNLASGRTSNYEGRGTLRSELRQLRDLGLVEKLPNRNIGDIQTGKTVDLSDYVKLTEFGKGWLQALKGS
jgi:hypothetical protein